MYGIGTWMEFEQALQSDQTLLDSFQSVVEQLIRDGMREESELLYRGAEKMGYELQKGKGSGEPVEALSDDALDHVAGGRSLSGDESLLPFDLNSWIGSLLRDLLKRNSAANSQNGMGATATTLPLPRPTTPEIHELNCL